MHVKMVNEHHRVHLRFLPRTVQLLHQPKPWTFFQDPRRTPDKVWQPWQHRRPFPHYSQEIWRRQQRNQLKAEFSVDRDGKTCTVPWTLSLGKTENKSGNTYFHERWPNGQRVCLDVLRKDIFHVWGEPSPQWLLFLCRPMLWAYNTLILERHSENKRYHTS